MDSAIRAPQSALGRKTKVVCTIGPASQSPEMLRRLLQEGMDIARLNFSHGSQENHRRVFNALKKIAGSLGKPLAVLQDLQGPKMRIGPLEGGKGLIQKGETFTLTTRQVQGSSQRVATTYRHLPKDVKPGDTILLGDGYLRLRVTRVRGFEVVTRVMEGGALRDHMGINLPGVDLSAPALSAKDLSDLAFGLSLGVDYVAMSFVRRGRDIRTIKTAMARRGRQVPVIAKLERPEAVANLEEILAAADGVMVARGDLGVEMELARVPVLQKEIIRRANQRRKLVITATEMLESMISNARPTRAEASDVANAIFDGTDAVMLSGETAVGHYPAEAVAMMAKIAATAESSSLFAARPELANSTPEDSVPDSTAQAAVQVAGRIKARAIVAFTQSGATALLISKYRPATPVIAFTPHESVRRRMALFWGVTPRIMRSITGTDELIQEVEKSLIADGFIKRGDTLVLLMGAPIYRKGTTDLLKVIRVGIR